MKLLLTFASIHYVLKAEKLLKTRGIPTEMVPVPKEISSDCGMALVMAEEDFKKVKDVLTGNVSPEGVYPWVKT